nr:hypothetical protein [uncultured bacterium]
MIFEFIPLPTCLLVNRLRRLRTGKFRILFPEKRKLIWKRLNLHFHPPRTRPIPIKNQTTRYIRYPIKFYITLNY